MGRITGKDGGINGIGCVRVWDVDSSRIGGRFSGSCAAGVIDRILGSKDWVGRYGAYGHTPTVMPGEAFAFIGSIDGSVGVYGTAIVESVRITSQIPQEENQEPKPVSHVVTFKANGALTKGAAVAADATIANPPNPGDLKFQYATPAVSPSWTTLSEVYSAEILLSCRNPTYKPGSSVYQTYRLKGNLDAQVEIQCQADDFSDLPAEGTIQGIKVFVTDTLFWRIDWMLVEHLNAMRVPVEAGEIVSATPQLAFKPNTLVGAVATKGQIINPSGSVWWPF